MPASLRERREAVVREHMESENRHDFDATIGTFKHPHYELVPTGTVFDGEAQVRNYFKTSRTAFPDQRNENTRFHHTDDAVIVEFFRQNGFRPRARRPQFFWPMAIHRGLSSPALSRALEKTAGGLGLRALFGSPVIARFDRA